MRLKQEFKACLGYIKQQDPRASEKTHQAKVLATQT